MKTFYDYLKEGCEKGYIDHALRATLEEDRLKFYIHVNGHDSDTLDFEVKENELIPLR